MVSIFKVIRENNVQVLNQLIGLATGEVSITNYGNDYLSKDDLISLQQQLKLTGSKNLDLNKRSAKGRTALHLAATWNRIEIAQLLIDCSLVNVNLQDRENGWTALHRALFMGNVDIARILLKRQDINLSLKDWEGLGAFELYDSTITDAFPQERVLENKQGEKEKIRMKTGEDVEMYNMMDKRRHIPIGGTDLYTWGQNTNYVLGHPDSENRNRPERIHFQLDSQQNPAVMKRPAYLIESVVMAKYHMAILTSESNNNLLVCGFGRSGRLGLGKDIDTQLVPTSVPWPERIMSVALGRDHTIAVTESGVVISFGSNEFGQLGYEVESSIKKDKVPMQLTPKKIQAPNLKKQPIIGAAASRIHSVVYTVFDLFTFGLNQGQLGYYQSSSDEHCQATPRKVSMSVEIEQVVANDNATAVLNKAHEVILLCNHTQQKMVFQFNRFPSGTQVDKPATTHVTKLISSGTEHLGAITNLGDVFIWTCKSLTKNNKMAASTPKRIWSSSKSHMVVVDASLGQYGEIIVCTALGHVFLGRPEGSSYTFKEVPYIQRCIRVCANSSGAFAAIRSECLLQPIEVTPSTLEHDICRSMPYMSIKEGLQKEVDSLNNQMEKECSSISDEDKMCQTKQDAIRQRFEKLINTAVDNAWDHIETESKKDKILDIVFIARNRHLYCHSSILACRSHIFKRLAKMADKSIGNLKIRLTKSLENRIEIHIDNCELASLLSMVDYIYTDQYQHPMKAFFRPHAICGLVDIKNVQRDLVTLAELFQLPHLLSSAKSSFNHQPILSLFSDLKHLIGHNEPDILLKTKDKEILCHEVILRQRCIFFNQLLSPQSVWASHRRKQQKIIQVDLEHMSSDVAETIVQYLYSDEDAHFLFDHIEKGTEEAMLNFLLDFLCEADALLISRLKLIAESVLIRFVKLRTVITIVEHADSYMANSLKDACLSFLKANLPVFLSSRLLDRLSASLIIELEEYVHESQAKKMPLVPKITSSRTNGVDATEVEDDEFSTSIYALNLDGSNNGPFIETLVTLYPEKPTIQKHLEIKEEKDPKRSSSKQKKTVRLSEVFENNVQTATTYNWATGTENQTRNKPSLRDILEETNHVTDMTSKTLKSTTPKKISQKDRRKMNTQLQELPSSQTTKPVWGNATSSTAVPLAKAMAEDEQQITMDRKGKKIYVPEDELINTSREAKSVHELKEHVYDPAESVGATFQLTPIRRFANASNELKSSYNIQSFQTIQNQQLEDHRLKNTKHKKNLRRIQKEEQAVAGLEQYSIQTLNIMNGEWFSIQRIATNGGNHKRTSVENIV